MNQKKTVMSMAFLLLGTGCLYAQESAIATGGEANGTGGSASYSIGQVVYTTSSGTTGTTAQGVQQPYEISTTVGIDETAINLDLLVYPNPTSDYLTLKVDDNTNLSYLLYDSQGKIIQTQKINNNATTISLEALPTSIYFLNVVKNNKVVKTFQIIKN